MKVNIDPAPENRVDAPLGAEVDALDLRRTWHPFTQMREYASLPRVQIESGQGCWLTDVNGKRYLDANASIWTNVHGHQDPDLNTAIIDQLGRVAHSTYLGLGHEPGARLADKLCSLTGLDRVFYSDNGSNAVEIALKLSFQYFQLIGQPKRRRVIAFSNAYHGDTFGTMSLGDCGAFHARFDAWKFSVERISAPVCDEFGGEVISSSMVESFAALDAVLDSLGDEVAAIILEPWVQGAGGMLLQPRGYLREVQARCRKHSVHLILDEVFVGFGRCGPLLVGSEEGVTPDFYCLAKGLTAGYLPLAATVTSEAIYAAFLGEFGEFKAFFHGHTFTGNPLGCVVALKSIEKLEVLIATGQLASTITAFDTFYRELRTELPETFKLRQRGLASALDLPAGDANQRRGMHFCIALRENGVLLRALGDSLLIVPPLVISSDEISFLKSALLETLRSNAYL
ncbi:adenosylmethionine--8-amino-7-oxononanoate transaminase [Cerasicoccus arenae]|uniref:Adenosylmethionine-8-amino-7-oxononanoate aminotransferase n=1 Tax=Cerasicoccus arenae TaxID=424488 RepID=A0A8J3D9X7_9BACT|nr:adenosylmethionine--8-amino-7-oxononanoate transaminase [Cerasicoccus arenae]MBK1859503.1 adenosylmethionine--8-amino-7-oxononanoate transaminase [Cerasicoccus arenae]GHB95021.1 adenosylmethionine-8-amino-7-oxononanoate aminotransferase [Cerasicoccus arenae]